MMLKLFDWKRSQNCERKTILSSIEKQKYLIEVSRSILKSIEHIKIIYNFIVLSVPPQNNVNFVIYLNLLLLGTNAIIFEYWKKINLFLVIVETVFLKFFLSFEALGIVNNNKKLFKHIK